MKKSSRVALYAALVLIVLVVLALLILPGYVEKGQNKLYPREPYQAPANVLALHKKLIITDMHSDSLLWDRNLNKRGSYGHVDFPRLIEGNVALQAFTIVTKVPKGINYDKNEDVSDLISMLALVQAWPPSAWKSLLGRALYQAKKLHRFAESSDGRFVLIKSSADLKSYLKRRKKDPGITAGFLGVEGAHALEGNPANVNVLFDAGVRMMSPTHFLDNDMSGSVHGTDKGGLTEKGKEMLQLMEAKKMIVDVAHASPRAIDDILRLSKRPVVDSHTGVRNACDKVRNLSDAQVKGITKRGGLICIGYWDEAACGTDAKAIARSIKYAVKIAGVRHVALGSDFDGATTTPFDTAGLAELTGALMAEGFSEQDIALIMGGNTIRFLEGNLP